jgi:hypothetical protein
MRISKPTEMSLAQLCEKGFDPAAPPAEAVARLSALRADDTSIAIAKALGQIVAPEAAALLTEMEAGSSGALRREIRRSLFRLRQHGVDTAEVRIRRDVVKGANDDSGLSGMISAIDVEGTRVVWIVKSRSGGGVKRLWGLVGENEGLLTVKAETLSRKELRAERVELEKRAGAQMIDAHWELADFIMCEAYQRTAEPRRARIGNFLALRTELIAGPAPVDFSHPVYEELAAEALDEPSPDLMKAPEIAAYRLPQDVLKPFVEEAAQLQQSTLILNRMVQQERMNSVLERAIDQLLRGELGSRLRRRLEDTAYYLVRTGKRSQAGWAVAAAAKLRDGADLKRSPFFQLFMRAQLGAVLAEEQEKEQEQPRLIMTPAEMMRARAAAQARAGQRGRLR